MQMRNQLKESLKTPEEERYSGKITRHDHFDDLTDIDNALNKVPEHLAIEERRRYTESCFGHLLRMDRGMKFSAGIVHRLLIRELHHDGPEDEMRFLLGRHSVRFSKVEFCLITGLKFGELPDTSTYDMVENGIHQRYFEGRDEVEYAELKAVLRIGDEREKVPVWQFRLVEDLDAFDAFPWGAHVYRRSIYGFKHALDGRRRRFEQRQRRKGVDVHTTETYNIYGLTHALLIFAFEVIPELGNSGCGKRREIELSPRILKWELSTRPRGEKLNSIFLESMFAMVKLVPTATERAERYFEGISQGGSLYDADLGDIPVPVSDPERYTTAGTSDTEGPSFEPSDTEGSDSDGRHIRLARTRRVRFTLPREPRTRDDSRTGDDSRGGVGGQTEDRRYTELMDALRELQEEVRKSNEKRDQQHQELLDLIRGLQGSTSHARTRGTRFDDPPFDDPDGHRDFSPRGRTGSHQGDQQGPGVTPREEVTGGTSGTDTTPMEIEEEPQQVLPEQPVHSQELVQSTSLQHTPPVDPRAEHPFIYSTETEIPSLSAPKELTPAGDRRRDRRRHSSNVQRTPTGDTGGHSPSTHRTSGGNTREQSSSLQLSHPVDHILSVDRITPPLQRQDRVRRAGWQQRTPYTDPCRPKRPRIRPQPAHVWAPHALIDPDHLAAYQAYKRNSTGELRDVDLLEPVGVPWFQRFQTNSMELEDTHMDAYLHILRKRQRYYSTVYGPRINILDSQFYSWLLNDWDRLMGSGADKPRRSWSMFKHQWSIEDLAVVRGLVPVGTKPWNEVDVVLIPCNLGRTHWALASVDLTTGSIYLMDPFRQEVPFRHRKMQLACLRYFLPSMLHALDFHGRRRRGDMTYTLQNKPFPLNIVSRDRVPQQDRGGNCGAHTLRLIEYLAANRDTFDWSENEMGTIREKMAVEVYCNSKDWSSS
ncbi:hypothetical protein LWI28_023143 [Acer negundo]|uniref:Ubiquitin-like protease family profile domain-containing protein n=1 Tax=Acer negundo TaxID=4023 RepID=A0AAD5J1V7_ACENE|nr:hypothetical protein LWI28_023143 [Acer negundo]